METSTSKDIVGQKLAVLSGELDSSDWQTREINYVATCKIVEADIPALIDIAFDWADGEFDDQADDIIEYQPVFAWRALGQLGTTEAIKPLLELSNVLDEDGDDWFLEEFPYVFCLIGEPALEPLSHFLADIENLEFARICAGASIQQIGIQHGALRDSAVQLLTQELGKFVPSSEGLSGSLVAGLLKLKAVESVETLEKAHSLNLVDTGMCGKWDRVKSELAVEGSGLAMPEFPYSSFYSQLTPAAARNAARRVFDEDGDLDHDALEEQNDILSRMFQQSPEFEKLTQEYWDWPCKLLELAATYSGVSFLDISIGEVNEVLFEVFPRKVSTPADSARQIVDELHHFFNFIARVFEIKSAKTIAESLTSDAAHTLHSELADSSNFGLAKSMWAQGSAAGFDMTSQADVAQYVKLYNDSLNPDNAGDPKVSVTMTPDEKRAFNKKRKKQLAKRQQKKKKKKKKR